MQHDVFGNARRRSCRAPSAANAKPTCCQTGIGLRVRPVARRSSRTMKPFALWPKPTAVMSDLRERRRRRPDRATTIFGTGAAAQPRDRPPEVAYPRSRSAGRAPSGSSAAHGTGGGRRGRVGTRAPPPCRHRRHRGNDCKTKPRRRRLPSFESSTPIERTIAPDVNVTACRIRRDFASSMGETSRCTP